MDTLLRRRAMIAAGGTSPTPPAPAGVVFYDHLVFDGTAYIETTYALPSGCSLKCEKLGGETVKAMQGLIMAQGNSGFIAIVYGGNTTSSSRYLSSYYDSSSVLKSTTLAFSTTNFTAFLTSKRFGIDNTVQSFTKGSKHPNGGIAFGKSSSQPYTGVMGAFYVYGSDTADVTTYAGFDSFTPVATFRPCTYNGEAGLWYVEGDAFFGNTAGSGSLLAEN